MSDKSLLSYINYRQSTMAHHFQSDAEMTFQLVALLALLAFVIYFYTSPQTSNTHKLIDPNECRSIITAGKHPNGLPNHLIPLASRALPNKRLKIAFGIRNAFTTVDEAYAKQFVVLAKNLVNLSSMDWNKLSGALRTAVRIWTNNQEWVKLTSIIQALSLRIILLVLFGYGDGLTDHANANGRLVDLAEEINRVWMRTKNTHVIPRFEDNIELQGCLAAIFPNSNFSKPEDNPLNLILPGFETLWRVAFRMFLEIAFTTGRQHPEWADMLIAFSDNPNKLQFARTDSKNHISPEHLVNEALRLYPPTRRVYRAFKTSYNADIETLSADIEGCHTSSNIWGPDAMVFNPGRWTNLTSQQRQAFLPFGNAPFICPAKPVFGPKVIALLVGCLVKELRGGMWRIEGGGVDVVEGCTGRLSNERGAYHDMYLVRK